MKALLAYIPWNLLAGWFPPERPGGRLYENTAVFTGKPLALKCREGACRSASARRPAVINSTKADFCSACKDHEELVVLVLSVPAADKVYAVTPFYDCKRVFICLKITAGQMHWLFSLCSVVRFACDLKGEEKWQRSILKDLERWHVL